MDIVGYADFTELFQPKPVGQPVNAHVVPAVREPAPDYAAMQRIIEGAPTRGPTKGQEQK